MRTIQSSDKKVAEMVKEDLIERGIFSRLKSRGLPYNVVEALSRDIVVSVERALSKVK